MGCRVRGTGVAEGLACHRSGCKWTKLSFPKYFRGTGKEKEKAFRQALLGIEWTGIALDWK